MERRSFIKNLSIASAAPLFLGGIPINLLASSNQLQLAASISDPDNHRALVLIQMHGGNDGLNMVIPINHYDEYYNLRPNIAISDAGARKYITLDSTLAEAQQAGLHPDMVGIKGLYDQGKVAIVQGVTYPNNNQSHFRSRDIWYMGGSFNENQGSGWAGRLLDQEFPNYPKDYPENNPMKDPLALEIGATVSLMYHRNNGIPVAISIQDPESFYSLIQKVGNTSLPEGLENTYYGTELKWISEIERKSDPYSIKLKKEFEDGKATSITYPKIYPLNAPSKSLNNGLSRQLELVARLLAGGCQTKIFVVRIGGFDTHANQVESYNSSYGSHAALLYHVSSAVTTFQNDLKARGIEDRVMTATFSEFGRRPQSNGSYGSDHGSAAPMLIFGKYVKPGVVGNSPDLINFDSGGNLILQNDYRSVFRTILEDWMQASPAGITATGFDAKKENGDDKYPKLDIVDKEAAATKTDFISSRFKIGPCSPNPAKLASSFSLKINADTKVSVQLYNIEGKWVAEIFNGDLDIGEHTINVPLEGLTSGTYTLKIDAGMAKGINKVAVIN